MNQAEIPMIALALIRSHGDNAFLKASQRAMKSRREGDFETARAWQRIAEIAHYEQLMATEEGESFACATDALPKWRQWLVNTSRNLRVHLLLTHRSHKAPQPFGVELDVKKAMDWILGHQHVNMHI